jgi:hypothetical protein
MDNKKFSTLMYWLTKNAARDSFIEFLDDIDLSLEDYVEIKKHLKEKYGVETYV